MCERERKGDEDENSVRAIKREIRAEETEVERVRLGEKMKERLIGSKEKERCKRRCSKGRGGRLI